MYNIQQLVDGYNSLTEEGKNSFKNQLGLMEIPTIPTIQTIYDRRMQFGAIARKRNLTLGDGNESGTDDNISNWHPNAKISTLPIPKGDYQMTPKEEKKEKKFLAEAEVNGLVFPSLDLAMQKHIADLDAGIFDKKETYRCIFYKEDGVVRELWCFHCSYSVLCLLVNNVFPERVLSAPSEFLCGNSN